MMLTHKLTQKHERTASGVRNAEAEHSFQPLITPVGFGRTDFKQGAANPRRDEKCVVLQLLLVLVLKQIFQELKEP